MQVRLPDAGIGAWRDKLNSAESLIGPVRKTASAPDGGVEQTIALARMGLTK
jgi:hypothetical protein